MTKGLITHRTHSAEQEMFENNNKQGSRIQAEPKLKFKNQTQFNL